MRERLKTALTPPPARLTPLEREVIAIFVQFSRVVGYQKSFAEIYGLLFISPEPLSMGDLIERLSLSKGAASQGLKALRELHAVRRIKTPGDRRERYEPETELRQVLRSIIDEQFQLHLAEGFARLDRAEKLAGRSKDAGHALARIEKLRAWEKRSGELLGLAKLFLTRPG